MGEIQLDGVTKVFPGGTHAVDGVSLTVDDGEFIVLVGPSGCGKSTLLRMIAGLEEPTEGRIVIGGRDVTRLAPRDRDIAMVFQNYALYPHLNVRANLGYGLKVRRTPKQQIARQVEEVARLLGLQGLLDRKPAQLSGGQRQRVAMGRAIVREPAAFLMDEPLSNLDAKLRVGMRTSLAELHARLRTTTVYVTHDQVEAMTLGQRVAVMSEGKVLQVDTPQALYGAPADLFVASFIGSPSMNLVEATVDGDHVLFADREIPLDRDRRPAAGGRVVLGIRPEAFESASFASPGLPRLEITVSVLEDLGADVHVIFPVDAPRMYGGRAATEEDARLMADERCIFTARVDPRTKAQPGERLELAIDPARLHFFDAETGRSLLP